MTCTTAIIILLTLILVLELVTRKPASSAVAGETEPDLADKIAAAQSQLAELQALLKQQSQAVEELAAASPDRLGREIATLTEQLAQLEAELPKLRTRAAAQLEARQSSSSEWQARSEDRNRLKTILAEAKKAREETVELKNQNRLVYNAAGNTTKHAWLVEISEAQIQVRALEHPGESAEFAGGWRSAQVRFATWLSDRGRATDYFVLLVRPSGVRAFGELQELLTSRRFDYGFDLVGEDQVVEIDAPKEGAGR